MAQVEDEDGGRPSIWSIHPDSHPHFVVVCALTGILLGVLYLVRNWSWPPCWNWSGVYDVAVDAGHMGLTAVSLAWTAFNGREAMRIASESYYKQRRRQGATDERKAIREYLKGEKEESVNLRDLIAFLNRREEGGGTAHEDETKENA